MDALDVYFENIIHSQDVYANNNIQLSIN